MSVSNTPFADPLWLNRQSSPYYKESHRRLQREVREYVDNSITPFCEDWEKAGSIPPRFIQTKHAELGYTAVASFPLAAQYLHGQRLPGDINPLEWDGFHDLIVIDELARCGYLGIVWGLGCGNSIGGPPVIQFGSEEQKCRFLPEMLKGKIRFCLGVTEPDAGSDVAGITTTAERKGDVYIVNGAKKWITNGMWADYCTAAVRTGERPQDISALIIPLKVPGVTCKRIHNSGVHASGSTYIELDQVEVPVANLLGEENKGFPVIMNNFNHERLWLACTSLRMARVCAEDAYQHAITRETFGKKLIENQVIRSKFSAMARSLDSAYAWMEQLVYMHQDTKENGTDAGMGGLFANLKVLAGRTLEMVNRESQQVMGGLGYSKNGRGARIEQVSRDVRVMVVGGGSEEILSELAVNQEIKHMKKQSKL
ncbi:hypothetical protein N7509_008504 [Penicillium cosmopolitanum]|uniref:Acyl-CoA dehydrogenase n=1 Tax=Penicillium cosmopolitanum TaxID=1131564 RepID=A0A9W9VMP8_9EURO|nr:uncharacterized protein N7509_008504 [Penicillium cosmopolitanum]KAJ5385963.1 hypothetical protein N7509_008504 [Penicillium cosmopolitanum]